MQVILAFWLVIACDLLEDRCMIDIIIWKFFSLCFKLAKSFENLDNILHDWTKDNVQKILVEAWNRYEKQEEQRKSHSFLENDSGSSRARLSSAQNWFW